MSQCSSNSISNMGCVSSSERKANSEARIILLGYDSAGKTALLYRFQLGSVVTTVPTVGFNVETLVDLPTHIPSNGAEFSQEKLDRDVKILSTIKLKDMEHGDHSLGRKRAPIEIIAWDVGGGAVLRPLWSHYYQDITLVVFVLDSTNRDEFENIRKELRGISYAEGLQRVSNILIIANKQDLPEAASLEEIEKALHLVDLSSSKKCRIMGVSAVDNQPNALYVEAVCKGVENELKKNSRNSPADIEKRIEHIRSLEPCNWGSGMEEIFEFISTVTQNPKDFTGIVTK